MVQDDKNVFQRVWGSTPVQTFFDYPGYIRDEGIQRYMETKEAFNEQGFLGGLGHIGREALSDVVGSPINPANLAASLLTGGRFPNDLADYIDPSRETKIGGLLENAYEAHRQTYGKDPSMAEKYDIMQNVQNEINPWLAETIPIAGMDVTKRGLVGLPVEGAVLAGEIALTGGMAAVAKSLGKKGAREAVEKAPQTLAGKAKRGATNVARESARQSLLIPKRVDDAIGTVFKYTIGKPLQYGAKGVLASVKGGQYALEIVNRKALNKLQEQNMLEGDAGVKLNEANDKAWGKHWYTTEQPKDWSVAEEPTSRSRFAPIDVELPRVSFFDTFRAWFPTVFGKEGTGVASMQAIKKLKDLATQTRDQGLQIADTDREEIRYYLSLMADEELFGKTFIGDVPTIEQLERYGKQALNNLRFVDDGLEARGLVVAGETPQAITFKKLVEINPKGSGEIPFNELKRLGVKITIKPEYQVDEKTGEFILRNKQRIEIPGKERYYVNAADLKTKGPGLGDVIEDFDHENSPWDAPLKALTARVTDRLLQPKVLGVTSGDSDAFFVDIGNGVRKYKNDELTLHEIVGRVRTMLQKTENEAAMQRMTGPFTRALARVFGDDGLMIEGVGSTYAPRLTIEMNNKTGQRSLRREAPGTRSAGSEAWLIHQGKSLANIADANHAIHRMIIDNRAKNIQSDFAKKFSTMLGLRHGSIADLVGNNVYDQTANSLDNVKDLLIDISTGVRKVPGKAKLGTLHAPFKEIVEKIDEITESRLEAQFTLDTGGLMENGEYVLGAEKIIRKEQRRLRGIVREVGRLINEKTKTKFTPILTKGQKRELNAFLTDARTAIDAVDTKVADGLAVVKSFKSDGYYFPDELHDTLTRTVEEIYKTNPMGKEGALRQLNGMMRTFGATGDMSAVAIQAIIPVMENLKSKALRAGTARASLGVINQGDSFTAMGDMVRAFGNEEYIGQWLVRQDAFAKANGLLTVDDALRAGVGLGGQSDYFVNANQWGIFSTLPVLKRLRPFDRAFSGLGTFVRWTTWSGEAQLEMLEKGMTKQEFMDSGRAAEIASAANKITGLGRSGFGGNAGEFLLFAPRFFKARLDTLSGALEGLAKNDQASLEQAVIRKYMASFIGMGTMLTVGINSMLGEETDFVPWRQNEATGEWYFNPNFMRTHMGDLDISFLGTWDTMLRLASTPAMLSLNQINDGQMFDGEKLLGDVRGLVSGPLMNKTWDMVTGSDAIGQRTTSVLKKDEETGAITEENWFSSIDSTTKTLQTMIESFIPFAWDDVAFADPGRESVLSRGADGFGSIVRGDVVSGAVDVGTAGAQGIGQFFGVKSSFETLTEILDEAEAGILELGPTDIRLQEAFGMNEKELGIYLAQHGNGLWDKGKLNIGAGVKSLLTGERTPDFTDLAKDYQKNIQRMQQEGRFPEFFSSEEWEKLQSRYNDRLQNSKNEYSMYQVKRDSLIEQEEVELANLENAFKEGTLYENPLTGEKINVGRMQDITTYYKMSRNISAKFSQERRSLTDPVTGEFKNLDELFRFGRETALGKISSVDADIYDYGQASFYDSIWGENGIVMPDGEINWEKREVLLSQWADNMKQRYQFLSDSEIASYMYRIENSIKKNAPPIKKALLEMTSSIQDSGYYDIERNVFYQIIDRKGVQGPEREQLIAQYARWKIQAPQDRKVLEENTPVLKEVKDRAKEYKEAFRAKHGKIDAMLRIVSSSKSKEALSNWGRLVDNLMVMNRKKTVTEDQLLSFFYNLLNEEVEYDQAYNAVFKI